jgi:serine/threonine protein kinase
MPCTLVQLEGVEGVCQIAPTPPRPGAILFSDVDGTSLRAVAKPMEPAELVRIGSDLAGVVAAVHRRGVLHRNISPANILLSRSRGTPWLIDFELATSLAEVGPGANQPGGVGASPAYLAPEQTRRTGRPVDQRADLWARRCTNSPPAGRRSRPSICCG